MVPHKHDLVERASSNITSHQTHTAVTRDEDRDRNTAHLLIAIFMKEQVEIRLDTID
jgi:hypothetical protein